MSLDLKDAIEAAEFRQEQDKLKKEGMVKVSQQRLEWLESLEEEVHDLEDVVADLSEKYQKVVCSVVTAGGQVDEEGNVYWKF